MILTADSPKVKKHKFKFIGKIGAELEGGWDVKPNFHLATDVSVHCKGNHLGELRTDPKSSLVDVFEELKNKYPDDIDGSCGFHVHVSLPPMHHARLAAQDYFEYFLARMEELGKQIDKAGNKTDHGRFLERLSGKNTYCAKTFDPRGQLAGNTDRRTMLNFCPYKEHGTIENRLFPMFELLSTARLAIFEYVDTMETYLSNKPIKDGYTLLAELADGSDTLNIKEEPCA